MSGLFLVVGVAAIVNEFMRSGPVSLAVVLIGLMPLVALLTCTLASIISVSEMRVRAIYVIGAALLMDVTFAWFFVTGRVF